MERTRRARCIEYSQRDVAKNKRRCVSPRRLLGNESLRIVFTRSCGVTSNVSRFILKYETERCSTSEEFASSSSGEIRIDRADPPSNTRSFKLFSSAREIRIYDTRMSREFLTELLRPRRAESIPLPDRERERERRSGCPCRNQSHLTRWVRRNFIYQILGARPTRLIRATLRIELCNTEGNRVLPALSISPRKPVRQPNTTRERVPFPSIPSLLQRFDRLCSTGMDWANFRIFFESKLLTILLEDRNGCDFH